MTCCQTAFGYAFAHFSAPLSILILMQPTPNMAEDEPLLCIIGEKLRLIVELCWRTTGSQSNVCSTCSVCCLLGCDSCLWGACWVPSAVAGGFELCYSASVLFVRPILYM